MKLTTFNEINCIQLNQPHLMKLTVFNEINCIQWN